MCTSHFLIPPQNYRNCLEAKCEWDSAVCKQPLWREGVCCGGRSCSTSGWTEEVHLSPPRLQYCGVPQEYSYLLPPRWPLYPAKQCQSSCGCRTASTAPCSLRVGQLVTNPLNIAQQLLTERRISVVQVCSLSRVLKLQRDAIRRQITGNEVF